MHIVVEFSAQQGACVEFNGTSLAIVSPKGEYPGDRAVGSIILDHRWKRRVEMVEHTDRNGGLVEQVERFVAGGVPVARSVLVRQARERDRNIRKLGNKSAIKVSEPKGRLFVFSFPWEGPIPYNLNTRFVHAEAVGADDEV